MGADAQADVLIDPIPPSLTADTSAAPLASVSSSALVAYAPGGVGHASRSSLVVTAFLKRDLSEGSIGALAEYWPLSSRGCGQPFQVFVKISSDKATLRREYDTLRLVRH